MPLAQTKAEELIWKKRRIEIATRLLAGSLGNDKTDSDTEWDLLFHLKLAEQLMKANNELEVQW